mgnify:CR=1 FL=1
MKFKNKGLLLVSLFFPMGSTIAAAGTLAGEGNSYMSLGAGYSDYTFWEAPAVQPNEDRVVTVEDSATTFAFNIGYHIRDNLALELFYQDFGDAETFDLTRDVAGATVTEFQDKLLGNIFGYGLAVKGYLPLGEDFTLYGKAGYMMWDIELTVTETVYENGVLESGPTKRPATAFDDSDPYLSLGLEFQVMDNVMLFGDIIYLHAEFRDRSYHTFGYMLGVRWNFKQKANWRSGANKRANEKSRGLTACRDEYKETVGGLVCVDK